MRKYILFIIFLPLYSLSQSLTKDRVDKLKKSVVRITIEGDPSTGTGFFISEEGDVLTCWHVIQPAIIMDSLRRVIAAKPIFMELHNGEKVLLGIPGLFFKEEENRIAVTNDFCVLVPINSNTKRTFLKIGNFNNINEGDEVYTAGYPLGITLQFISKGILSTKYIDSSFVYQTKGKKDVKANKSVALLDLTLNKGNSGGPIIKLGKTIDEDEVIGIANFLINPFGQNALTLFNEMQKDKTDYRLPSGVSLTNALKLFSNAIVYSSNGISGCVSINHFLQLLK